MGRRPGGGLHGDHSRPSDPALIGQEKGPFAAPFTRLPALRPVLQAVGVSVDGCPNSFRVAPFPQHTFAGSSALNQRYFAEPFERGFS